MTLLKIAAVEIHIAKNTRTDLRIRFLTRRELRKFIMIYLYIKIHNKTGLKYLGKTKSKDPHKYKGSGKRWLNHINKHGYDVTTEIIFQSENPNEIKEMGIYYSTLYNVVEDKTWANLKEESGDGGWDHLTEEQIQKRYTKVRIEGGTFKDKKHTDESKQKIKEARAKQIIGPRSEETKKKISETNTGHDTSIETRKKISDALAGKPSNKKNVPLTEEHKAKLSISQKKRFETSQGTFKDKKHTDESKQKIKEARAKQTNIRKKGEWSPSKETRKKMSESRTGRKQLDETKAKISKANKGRPKRKVTCPHCGKVGGSSQMKRWHFDNCKKDQKCTAK